MPDFLLERAHWDAGRRLVAGVDEAGRGCLAGPVVAAAVILPPEAHLPGLDDSKALSAPQRQRLVPLIHAQALAVGVGMCSPAEVDTINVLWAAMEAMRRAIVNLALMPDAALIDGNKLPPEAPDALASGAEGEGVMGKGKESALDAFRSSLLPSPFPDAVHLSHSDRRQRLAEPQDAAPASATRQASGVTLPAHMEAIVKGDAKSLSIAAASVIAKVTRDEALVALDRELPAYGFAQHKGYPTAQHYAAIAEHGPTPHHRYSFRLTR